ncbi:unnamed protein product [Symbiodinium natans]|uniref:Uncharacterized protein n=1 Tax=Symbiodinium natans TaxID=878477 RepID=A0A812ULU1_9DINO|nr:unnamed protein product [Symbiodinium natans]
MLRVSWATSGEELAAIPVEELRDVMSLKQRLQQLHGISRYRQRFLSSTSPLEDHDRLDAPMDVQLVLLPFVSTSALAPEVLRGDVAKVETMLLEPQDPNIVTPHVQPPLLCAVEEGHMQLARMLMDAKADAAVEGHGGYAALQQAAKMGHPDMVCLLLEEGVEVNMADSQGWTALHVAAMLGHKEIAELLLDAGIDKHRADKNGLTALAVAKRVRQHRIVDLLC